MKFKEKEANRERYRGGKENGRGGGGENSGKIKATCATCGDMMRATRLKPLYDVLKLLQAAKTQPEPDWDETR